MSQKIITVAHSGDLGDLVYALAGLKWLAEKENAKIEIYLVPDPRVREQFTLARAYNIGTFLQEQPYCAGWRHVGDRLPFDIDIDFRHWRTEYAKDGHSNLAESQAKFVGAPVEVVNEPWLTVPRQYPPSKIIIARSHRYRNPEFPWCEVADILRNDALIVGTASEHEELIYLYGLQKRVETRNVSELAMVLSSAPFVVTNQTLVYALAEGMKKTVLLERWDYCSNCDFARPGVITDPKEIIAYAEANRPKSMVELAPKLAPPISGIKAGAAG